MATQGLFDLLGPSPEEVRAKYEQSLYQNLDQVPLANLPGAMASGLGRRLGYSLGRMLGGQLPGEAEAAAQQQVLSQAQKAGLSGSALYKRLAETTADPRRALQFAQLAQQAEAAEAKAARETADAALARRLKEAQVKEAEGKPGAEKLAIDNRKNTVTALVPNANPALVNGLANNPTAFNTWLGNQLKDKAPNSPIGKLLADRDALPEDDPRRKIYDDRIKQLTNTNNTETALTLAISGLVKAATGGTGKEIGVSVSQIPSQEEAAKAIQKGLDLLDKGIYSGFYGKTGEFASEVTGGVVGSSQRVTNTQLFRNHLRQVVIPRLKEFGGNDSVEELRFLERAEGGDTSITADALRATLESSLAKIQRGIKLRTAQYEAMKAGKAPPMSLPEEPKKRSTNRRWNPQTGKAEPVKE